MSYTPAQFAAEIALNGKTFYAYPNVKAELTLMSTAVKADTTKHDRTLETPLGILQNPNSYYQAQINRAINRGKAGNLTVAQMGAAMDAVVAAMP
jgi:hypothetical protein